MSINVIEFNISKISDTKIRTSFKNFLARNKSYRNDFLQSNYKNAFDGYSYIGQKDSLNQYDTDMLYSFVLSDFHDINKFPMEFHYFLLEDWKEIKRVVRQRETEILKKINNPNLNRLYENNAIGYMISCNYYPKPKNVDFAAQCNKRLSLHKDVSLLTTFPFGISKGFSYFKNKNKIELGERNNIFSFPGYFLEFSTNKTHTALSHQVDLPTNTESERFSFAIFSIPKPNINFKIEKENIQSNDYYKQYLSLF